MCDELGKPFLSVEYVKNWVKPFKPAEYVMNWVNTLRKKRKTNSCHVCRVENTTLVLEGKAF